MSIKSIYLFVRRNLEAFIWIAALIVLAFSSPADACYSLCPLANLGINWCPGCGLGSSITWIFRGDLVQSWQTHPLGIPALLIIMARIFTIFRKYRKYNTYLTQKSV